MPGPINPLGAQYALGSLSAAKALTLPTTPNLWVSHCLINVNSQAVRYTTDGTAPTATKGIHVAVGGQISFMDPNFDYRTVIRALLIIEEVASATLDILYFNSWASV